MACGGREGCRAWVPGLVFGDEAVDPSAGLQLAGARPGTALGAWASTCHALAAVAAAGADRDDDHVQPGTTYTYTWQARRSTRPAGSSCGRAWGPGQRSGAAAVSAPLPLAPHTRLCAGLRVALCRWQRLLGPALQTSPTSSGCTTPTPVSRCMYHSRPCLACIRPRFPAPGLRLGCICPATGLHLPAHAPLPNCCPLLRRRADEVEDVYAGLVGALVIGRKGSLKADLTAQDVDK